MLKTKSNAWIIAAGLLLAFLLQACTTAKPLPGPTPTPSPRTEAPPPAAPGQPKPYRVFGSWYHPIADAAGFEEQGIASWYGEEFHGRKTSNGEVYDMYARTAAHKTLPMGTFVRVHNLSNDRTIDVRINDRGPFVKGRIIDLSYTAAKKLDLIGPGTGPVKIFALGEPEGGPGQPARYKPLDYYSGNFTFQVGAFAERGNAERLVQQLESLYENAHMVPYFDGSRTFYRVRVGLRNNLEEAEQFERVLAENGYPGVFIVAE
jgi:rare lipoprotein A